MSQGCPDRETLAWFSRGLLVGIESTRIETHLQNCPTCLAASRATDPRRTTIEVTTDPVTQSILNTGPMPPSRTIIHPMVGDLTRSEAGYLDRTDGSREAAFSETERLEARTTGQWLGRYRLLRVLGSGAFGKVYLGRDPELDRDVAIKVPHSHRIRSLADVEQYLNEARTLAALDHPHVLPVYDAGRTPDGACYLVAKYVEGTDLATVITLGRGEFPDSARLMIKLAEGLHHAHSRNLIHRDIKPANILIAADGHPYLADFGLALNIDQPLSEFTRAGTPEYMSPEQARGEGHRIDGRSDIYSLGMVFYRLLCGHRPYEESGLPQLLHLIATAEIPAPSRFDPEVPPELDRVCLKMLAKRSVDRYATALEVVDDLRAWLDQPAIEPSDPQAPAIPKGLRSFDGHDAHFFLKLLPGLRDREGIPESVAFWKRRIESDGAEGFSVGLLLGTSGSGKSSMLRAGLIPRLDRRVVPIYLEASPTRTEASLLIAIRCSCPRLPQELSLPETLAEVRRGGHLPVGQKVVLIFDQFEQWLATEDENGLVEALRQADGHRLTALLVARDDFAIAATRFLDRLEVPLVQGKNFGTIDRFSTEHARNVLETFGKALGRTPSADFLGRSVKLLEESGRVNPARLALFVQMLAEKEWTAAKLRDLGGVDGLGLAFLQESIHGPAAHPILTRHSRAVRSILESLLPAPGIDLKGSVRTRSELVTTAGLQDSPQVADELFRVLDTDLRLITPTSSEGSVPGEIPYQLTHDYLVSPIRRWLNKDRLSTFRGRVGVRLAEQSAEWNAQPFRRNLPAWWDFLLQMVLTDRKTRTEPERRMMAAAARAHGARAGVGLVGGGLIAMAATVWRNQLDQRLKAEQADSAVQQVLRSAPEKLNAAVGDLGPLRAWTDPKLGLILSDSSRTPFERRRARFALRETDPELVPSLMTDLIDPAIDRNEALAFLDGLGQASGPTLGKFWSVIHDEHESTDRRSLAGLALARLDPVGQFAKDFDWLTASPFIAGDLLDQLTNSPSSYRLMLDAYRPVRRFLTGPLVEVAEGPSGPRSELATNLLIDLDGDRPDVLVPLAISSGPARLVRLGPWLDRSRSECVRLLHAELVRPSKVVRWPDAPIPAAWAVSIDVQAREIESAGGMITDRFAFAPSIPMDRLVALTESLRSAHYRPTRVRPYLDGDHLSVAVVWTRDPRGWRLDLGLGLDSLDPSTRKGEAKGLEPVDLAAYSGPDGSIQLACLRADFEPGLPWSRALTFESDNAFRRWSEDLDRQPAGSFASIQTTHQVLDLPGGGRRHSVVVSNFTRRGNPFLETRRLDGISGEYRGDRYPGRLQTEVSLGRVQHRKNRLETARDELAEVDRKIQEVPDDPGLIYSRAIALYQLDRFAESKKILDDLIIRYPPYAWQFQMLRSLVHARVGQAPASRDDFEAFRAKNDDAARLLLLEVSLAGVAGRFTEGRQLVRERLVGHENDSSFLEQAAGSLALLATTATEKKDPTARGLTDDAIDLLRQAVEKGCKPTRDSLADFDEFLDDPKLIKLVGQSRLDDRYTALWQIDRAHESVEIHGLSPEEHRTRSRALAARGDRIVATTAFRGLTDGEPVMASVWHRPILDETDRQKQADQTAMATLALFRMGEESPAWEQLQARPDPRVASAITHGLGLVEIRPERLLNRLKIETRPDVRRALLIALGGFPPGPAIDQIRSEIRVIATGLYRFDPDPGVHSAARWLVETLGRPGEPSLNPLGLASEGPVPGRQWYINRQGQEFSVVRGPQEFLMGAPASSHDGPDLREYDQHQRKINRSFAIAAREVTNSEFGRFLQANPDVAHPVSQVLNIDPEAPITSVSWQNAARYCRWLTTSEGIGDDQQPYTLTEPETVSGNSKPARALEMKVGYLLRTGYRLPTEAEWEFAARAGAATRRAHGWSDDLLGDYEWSLNPKTWILEGPHPVGQLRPNPLGCFDLLGNIAEWTSTRFEAVRQAGEDGVASDPESPSRIVGDDNFLLRGATAWDRPSILRSSWWMFSRSDSTNIRYGFRLARTLPGSSETAP